MLSLVLVGGSFVPFAAGSALAPDPTVTSSAQTAYRYPTKEFVARVLGSTEDVWGELFKTLGNRTYPEPTVVLFTAKTRSACGPMSAAAGPAYCPADFKVYVDPAWLDELSQRLGAQPNSFGQAYLIVREVSRHAQNVLGTTGKVDEKMRRMDAPGRDALAVRLELQADCLTGIWAHFAQKRNQLEPGDVVEGERAAAAQRDASTGASAQRRMKWFRRGLKSGDLAKCDTFAVSKP